jgi:hypothetical protein
MRKHYLLFILILFFPRIGQTGDIHIGPPSTNVAAFWIDQSRPNENIPPKFQKWGFVFTVPDGEALLDTATFFSRSGNQPSDATYFQIKLSKWDNVLTQPIYPAIYVSALTYYADQNPSDPNAEWGTPPTTFQRIRIDRVNEAKRSEPRSHPSCWTSPF